MRDGKADVRAQIFPRASARIRLIFLVGDRIARPIPNGRDIDHRGG